MKVASTRLCTRARLRPMFTLLMLSAWMVSALRAQVATEAGEAEISLGAGRLVRGTITQATADHLTVKTESGEVYQVVLTPNTQLRKGRDPIKAAQIHAGDGVGAMGEIEPASKTVHALFVTILDAEQVRKAREDLGKTWIAGKVTAIDELRLTVLRADKVTQVIEVDEGTSFKRGGRGLRLMFGSEVEAGGRAESKSGAESITLGDVKIGDTVVGPGVLRSGVFIPTQLAVADPAAQGVRRRRGESVPAAEPQ